MVNASRLSLYSSSLPPIYFNQLNDDRA